MQDKNFVYKNFDNSYEMEPEKNFFPETLEQIVEIVKNNQNKKIRISGSIHVFNDMSICDEIMVIMSKMNKILKINKQKKTVSVEPGILLYIFVQELEKNDLAMHVLPIGMHQSLAGVLSTSTHGSRIDTGSFAEAVLKIKLVLHNGEVRKIRKGDDLFPAITVSLGTIGIICAIKLQCEDLYFAKEIKNVIPWEVFIENMPRTLAIFKYTMLYVHPYKRSCEVRMIKRLNNINDLTEGKHIDVYYKITSNVEQSLPYTEIEITIDLKDLDAAMKDIFKLYEQENYKDNSELLVRFIGENKNSYIAMSSDRKYNVSISIFSDAEKSKDSYLLNFFKKYHDLLVNNYNGRPHYGKKLFLDREQMKRIYPKLNFFSKAKRELDPNNIFTNDYIERLFDTNTKN